MQPSPIADVQILDESSERFGMLLPFVTLLAFTMEDQLWQRQCAVSVL
jgi:hypothetical protein